MHPIAFKIGDFPIYFYGIMMVMAYVVVLILMKWTCQYENFTYDEGLDITIYTVLGGVVGARLFYVMLNLSKYLKEPLHIFFVREGGLSWHGALLGGFVFLSAYSLIKKLPLGRVTDFAAVHSTIALAVGRIGCFLNGCCYGKECELPWAVEFQGAHISGLRHPNQIYETLMLIVAFVILLRWWKWKKFNGEMTLAMFAIYGFIRFVVEFFRDTPQDMYWGMGLSAAQWLSLCLMIVFPLVILFKRKKIGNEEKNISTT